MEGKITLDKAAFKALASETRVSLLKKLGNRRATPSELAQSLGVSPQAASEHLAQLERAGLVRRDSRPEDEGRKWVYFSLTEKGRALVAPSEQRKIWVLLSVAAVLLAFGAFSFFGVYPGSLAGSLGSIGAARAPAAGESLQGGLQAPEPLAFRQEAAAAGAASENAGVGAGAGAALNYGGYALAGIAAFAALFGGLLLLAAAAYYYLESKRSRKKLDAL